MANSGVNNVLMTILLLLLLFSCLATISHATRPSLLKVMYAGNYDEYKCVYTIYIRTGSIWKAGTDSMISLALAGADGVGVLIEDLESWGGLMGANYDYYERGNLDIFSGRGPCITSWPPCWMNLTSDGSGSHHGWYCNYVEVTTTGPHIGCSQQLFTVEQWLARDASPYRLYATRDYCGNPDDPIGDKKVAPGSHVAHVE
ncbi:hypothetical protein OPV22_005392 [Ensete ventricosum]|uniref:PLAT domain-containing protein n=1 Tax=Ensete ventricosum TaxID=4639 RepID=A0AAV8Q2P7_ENSVE|nr:hypothetical protein OPV22_005392 [Ensete ventricosum]